MAVTVEKRPIGVVLDSGVSATINSDYSSAFATVNKTAHGLSDGDYVYIKSNVENYNGFWKIDVRNSDEFLLIDNPYVAWIVDADITYYPQVTTHGWSCVNLPIVYELSNTRYPVNSVDTERTVSSISNDLGYVNLNLSGSLGSFEELSFIKISNAGNSSLDGVYQVIEKVSTSDVTINLAYSAVTTAGIVGATIQLYYSSYNILVRIYAGLNSSHEWADQKPYELAATLQFIPDENNRVRFSVSEILKAYVDIKNNLTLATLPNNIDAFTQFYIEVAEQYDVSNGYTITTSTSGYTSDQLTFEGYAVNAKLPFKNVHSGYLSEYIMVNSSSKFLTLFAIPVLFACSDDLPDCYNEITFIKPDDADYVLNKQYYSNGIAGILEEETISGDEGIYRVPIDPSCDYDRVDMSLSFETESPTYSFVEVATFPTIAGLGTQDWSSGQAVVVLTAGGPGVLTSYIKYFPYESLGSVYGAVSWEHTVLSGSLTIFSNLFIVLMDADLNIVATQTISTGTGISSGTTTIDLTASVNTYYIGMYTNSSSAFSNQSRIFIDGINLIGEVIELSETKEFKIDCGCSNQEIRISWMNNLGAMETPWAFTGETEHAIDITNSGETKENIFPSWPNSYGEFADTIRKQTFRESANRKFVFSQFLTQDEADAISYIKSSPLVQIVNSRTDRRTVIVDTDSFTKYADGDKTYRIEFSILYTDDIPSQT